MHASLAEAQRAVMQEVTYILKEKHQGLNYAVATEENVISALRPSMLRHGIVMCPIDITMMDAARWDGVKQGQVVNLIRLIVTYRFTHADSKDFQDVRAVGESRSFEDKACAAAMTMAQKYALLEFFLLVRGTDPELVYEHRGERNEEQWQSAVSYIDGSATEQKLDSVMENIRTKARSYFSDDDIAELAMYCERRRLEIRKSESKRNLRQDDA